MKSQKNENRAIKRMVNTQDHKRSYFNPFLKINFLSHPALLGYTAVLSMIEQRPEGWTVVNSQGAIKLRLADGSPAYLPTREEVVEHCRISGLYEAKAGNPADLAEGVLVQFLSTRPTDAISQAAQEAMTQNQPSDRPRG